MSEDAVQVSKALKPYLSIARPDHWIKNGFMIPGSALAIALYADELTHRSIAGQFSIIALAFVAACLLASANYTINEWLDAESDRHHPTKFNRPAPLRKLDPRIVYAQYAGLAVTGLALALAINTRFFLFSVVLLVMGIVYNAPPIRSKDMAYIDVLSESLNNPIRLLLGWSALLPTELPPVSIVICYWMGGAYLMTVKRYAEYRLIGNADMAARYRRSFAHYSETKLLVSALFYAINAAFFLGIFLIKYRFEYLVSFPMFALLFSWYLALAMKTQASEMNPERLYQEKRFAIYVCVLVAVLIGLLFVDLPFLDDFVDRNNIIQRR
jgi:decaprenyl-phosphate phosphoribosyltransferase